MSDRIIQAYYGEYPRINKRTPVDITARITSDHFASLFEAIEDDCNIEPYGYKIGDYFESHNAHTVTQDLNTSGTESNTVKFRYWLAHPDLYYGGYSNNAVTDKHHLAIVVDFKTNKRWNDGTFTGYEASRLHVWLKGSQCLDNIKKDLNFILTGGESGSAADSHLVGHKKYFSTYNTSTSKFNFGWSANDEVISALTEMDIYGAPIFSRKEDDQNNYQQGEAIKQLEIFRKYRFNRLFENRSIWLRSNKDASSACAASRFGSASGPTFSYAFGSVGIILLKADPT